MAESSHEREKYLNYGSIQIPITLNMPKYYLYSQKRETKALGDQVPWKEQSTKSIVRLAKSIVRIISYTKIGDQVSSIERMNTQHMIS